MKEVTLDEARTIIRRVLGYGHESVIEHACFTFFIEGHIKEPVSSISQTSNRFLYSTEHEVCRSSQIRVIFIKPESIEKQEELSGLFDDAMTRCKTVYDTLRGKGVPPEDARFVLPIATQTKIAFTMNARELKHFFMMRCCLRAQWE